jgi:hypothetical protein
MFPCLDWLLGAPTYVLRVRDRLIDDYEEFTRGFLKVRDERIRASANGRVSVELPAGGPGPEAGSKRLELTMPPRGAPG